MEYCHRINRIRETVLSINKKGKITNKEYRTMFNISDRTSLTDLNDLRGKGLLEKTGITGRGIAYNLTRNKPEKPETNPKVVYM